MTILLCNDLKGSDMTRTAILAAMIFFVTPSAPALELPTLFDGRFAASPGSQIRVDGSSEGTRFFDLTQFQSDIDQGGTVDQSEAGKSPKKAVLLSGLVPGSGEYYLGAKKKAALFFGVEALLWGLYFTWDTKGNDIEDEFRAEADLEYDPFEYIQWLESSNAQHSVITHDLPCEEYLDRTRPGEFGDCASSDVQQYYELIGKYDQFVSGWSDVRDLETENTVQPSQIDNVANFDSEKRHSYEDRRHDSNRFLKRAITAAGFVLINHVASAIDAGRTGRAMTAAKERRNRVFLAVRPDRPPLLIAARSF